jgi:hypothetical protein
MLRLNFPKGQKKKNEYEINDQIYLNQATALTFS